MRINPWKNKEDKVNSQFGDNTDTDLLPELHSVPMQPTSLKNREQNLPNDILLEAMKIAGNEKDLENWFDDLPVLFDIKDENWIHLYGLVNNNATTASTDLIKLIFKLQNIWLNYKEFN